MTLKSFKLHLFIFILILTLMSYKIILQTFYYFLCFVVCLLLSQQVIVCFEYKLNMYVVNANAYHANILPCSKLICLPRQFVFAGLVNI